MKNIHVLPTDKPSRLYKLKATNKFILHPRHIQKDFYMKSAVGKNIYITSNKKPQKGCYYICNNIVKKCNWLASANGLIYLVDDLGNEDVIDFCKKIILTDNEDLIKDGVQVIDDEFLEWFVKNPSCERVEVKKFNGFAEDYLIILPKEELKQIDEKGNPLTFWGGLAEPKQELERGITITHVEKQEKLHNLIKERLNRKEEQFKHEVKSIPKEEILANRSNAYEFIDFDKKETEELNPYIGPFLLKNGFEKFKYKNNIYTNPKCTINVLEGCYEILFENEYGEVSAYTDSWSIPHLVGTLTWNDLIDKNYNK